MFRCSRFCNCQSTQEQQGSTRVGHYAVDYSIESTYFLSISTDFHKRCDLFWDRWSHLHNLHELNGLQNGRWGVGLLLEFVLELHWRSTQIHFRMISGVNRET